MHLQRSRTGYPSGVSSFVRNGRCGRDRGLANTVGARGSSCTSVSWRKSTFGAGVCAQRHCQKRPQNPVFGRCWHQTWQTIGRQRCTHQSPVTTCPSVLKEWWRHGPIFRKKQTVIFLCAADLFSFWGGDLTENSQTADCILIS